MTLFRTSHRTSLIKPSAIRKMLEASASMKGLAHLEQGEPDFATPQHIVDAACDAAQKGFTHYTPIEGLLDLREAIADKLEKDNHLGMNPKNEITVTSGSQEAMIVTALGFLNRGDEALILDPHYPACYEDTLLAEAKPILVPLRKKDDYHVDPDALEEAVTEKTRLIWLCNPCNPTGHVYSKQDLETVAETAKKHNLLVFSDEIYEKIVYDGTRHLSTASFPGMKERTITANGFSKAYAMTGWRVGYMAAQKELMVTLRNVHYYAVLCPNAISQKAALCALNGPQKCVTDMVNEYARRRRLVLNKLSHIDKLSCSNPRGAFYVFPDFREYAKSDEKLAMDLLSKAKVVTAPGSGFGESGRGHLRISYSAPSEQVEEGMERIDRYLQGMT